MRLEVLKIAVRDENRPQLRRHCKLRSPAPRTICNGGKYLEGGKRSILVMNNKPLAVLQQRKRTIRHVARI